eukprot:323329_1
MTAAAIKILSAITLFYMCLILTPLCSYWTYALYKHRQEIFIGKRNLKMSLALNISLISYIISTGLFTFAGPWNLPSLVTIASVLLYATLWLFLYSLVCKTWMIHYDFKWTYYTLSSEWTTIIDRTSHSHNWYLKHRKTCGNVHWFAKVLFGAVVVLCVVSFEMADLILSGNQTKIFIGLAVTMISILCPIVTYIVILCKTPNSQKFNDAFYIHWEAKLVAKLLGIFVLLFIVLKFVHLRKVND